jgi:hypothetical protein
MTLRIQHGATDEDNAAVLLWGYIRQMPNMNLELNAEYPCIFYNSSLPLQLLPKYCLDLGKTALIKIFPVHYLPSAVAIHFEIIKACKK